MHESKEDTSKSPGMRHVSFLLKAAHSLSKYHSLPSDKIAKSTVKYLRQKERRIKDGMRYFLRVSPKHHDIKAINHKIILVCKALIKVVSHKYLQHLRSEYAYMNDLEVVCKRLIEKFEQETDDGVGEPENLVEEPHLGFQGPPMKEGEALSDKESDAFEEELSELQGNQ